MITHIGKYALRLGLAASARALATRLLTASMVMPSRLVKGNKARVRSAFWIFSLLAFPMRRCLGSASEVNTIRRNNYVTFKWTE